jgi:putative CocE/NonD family hydrolase
VKPPFYVPGPVDQGPILDRRDVLVYTSDSLTRDVEVIGPVTAKLFVATSGPSTDFTVKLCDVHPDGRTINLCDGIARVNATAGSVTEVDVDMWATGVVFQAGHHIRVLVSSSDFPRYERNSNTGQNAWEAAVLEPALQRVFHDGSRASSVVLPVTG